MDLDLYIQTRTDRAEQLIGMLPWQPLHFVADFDEADRVHPGLVKSTMNTPCHRIESSLSIMSLGLSSLQTNVERGKRDGHV